MSEKDKPSCAAAIFFFCYSFLLNVLHNSKHFITASLTVILQKVIFFIFFYLPTFFCPQITVLVTLHQPLVIVCFSLVLD